jgi:tetratricopeptide (TPR) repeat protein
MRSVAKSYSRRSSLFSDKIDLSFQAMLASQSSGEKGMRKALWLLQTLILAACCARAPRASYLTCLPHSGRFLAGIRGQIQEAYADVRAHPDDATANGRLGMILQTYGLLQEAEVCYRRAIRLEPSTFRWAYYLAAIESDGGHCDAAFATLRRSLRVAPDYVPAQLRLANCLLASADWNASEELYGAIIKQHPDTADAYYGLGRVRAARRDFAGAADAYGKACALFPDFSAAHYALALIYRALGQDGKANEQLHLFEKNKDGAPPSNDALLNEVRALNLSATNQVQMGIELERQGRLEESVTAHEKALQIDSHMVQAHINLLELYGRLGQFEKAEEHYRAATRLEPGSVESYYHTACCFLPLKNLNRLRTLSGRPSKSTFSRCRPQQHRVPLGRQGKLAEAAAEYRKAVDNKPSDRQTHFNLGRVLVNQHAYREGIQELEKTIEPEDENTPRYIYALGAAFARSGDRQNALRYIRQARDGALARGQSGLADSVERDLRILETPPGTPQ